MKRSIVVGLCLALFHQAAVEADPATGEAADFALPGGGSMRFVWIEPGSFLIGSAEDEPLALSDEFPQHRVTIERGFYMGQFEITQAQWTEVTGQSPWEELNRTYVKGEPTHPAVYITWLEVQAFIDQLNEWEGAEVYRLPTEAEWEYAARAGTTTPWSWGADADVIDDYAWHRDNTFFRGEPWAHPVGQKLPNPWGLYDVHGNAWEWVLDWAAKYVPGDKVDPTGPQSGSMRIVRGGLFMGDAQKIRSAFRFAGFPDFPDGGVGARLIRQDPDPDTAVEAASWGRVKRDTGDHD